MAVQAAMVVQTLMQVTICKTKVVQAATEAPVDTVVLHHHQQVVEDKEAHQGLAVYRFLKYTIK